MYLKSIEVQGFKSFANKIVFDFHNGITGIVGPNGSGKSNVADAVRWVLGEQSVKQLRGGSMQDVIFSGTENRKPLSYASVAITLDNSDHKLQIEYEEVTVTRKLYRSGESEYLINGSTCRLRDIHELFYDTGIGKEGYSIIGQGQIDKILSGKPEDRRELFDEAAGIVKFKRRKKMSVKKLEEERQNLLRVTDILSEIEKQIGPLEKQSEVAKEYLQKKSDLKTYDINMFLLEADRLKQEIASVDQKLQNTRQELEEASIAYDKTKEEYEKIEEEVEVIDYEIESFRSKLNETNLLKQQLENQIALLKEQIHSAKQSDEHFENRVTVLEAEIREKKEELSNCQKEEAVLKEEIASLTEKDKEKSEKLRKIQIEIGYLNQQIETDKNSIIQLLNNRASTKAMVQRYDTMLEQISVRKSEMNQRLLSSDTEAEQADKIYKQCLAEHTEISEKIQQIRQQITSKEKKIEELQTKMSQLNMQLKNKQVQYHRDYSRLESLRNITERYDGYGNSIKRVMEMKKNEPGLLGVVADIIKVDSKYELAIETALGGSIQNIVTDHENTAKKMINYLKQNKFGRATFLPLSSIQSGNSFYKKEALHENGVIGIASTLVKAESQYQKLTEHLLGKTLVVDTIDHGIVIARKYQQSIRLVTVDGELINPGGAMTGGAFKNNSNLLGRRREIEELEKAVDEENKQLNTLEQSSNDLRTERTESYAQIEELKKQLNQELLVQNTIKINLEQAKRQISAAKEMSVQAKQEAKELDSQIQEIYENQESIAVELETSESLEKELEEKIELNQNHLDTIRDEEQVYQKDVEEVRLSLANYKQKEDFAKETMQRIGEEIQKNEEELCLLSKDQDSTSSEILEKEEQIKEIKETIDNSKELFDELELEIKASQEKKVQLNNKHKLFLQKREDISKHKAELDKEIFRLESKKESYEEQEDKQINYMWDEYEITYNRALELRDVHLTDLSFIKKKIQQLKQEIKGLGSVNVNAIEDFKELSERYEFLKKQHEDLVQAEETLLQIIEELDQAMRKQFAEEFGKISTEFDHVFKELFGGGKGTLELMEDEDILEAGVKIIAQPPGKKLQNMMQLSGGEKALTAIALLFAIQNLKPSPFCLLDEIEAALDDSNVTRFAKYLHKLTEYTQFIVITHRRGTMTAADRLYGITMQEKGISTLVSVSLLEDQLDA